MKATITAAHCATAIATATLPMDFCIREAPPFICFNAIGYISVYFSYTFPNGGKRGCVSSKVYKGSRDGVWTRSCWSLVPSVWRPCHLQKRLNMRANDVDWYRALLELGYYRHRSVEDHCLKPLASHGLKCSPTCSSSLDCVLSALCSLCEPCDCNTDISPLAPSANCNLTGMD